MTETANKYCTLEVLTNESSVEQFFIARLLIDLGFKDSEIKAKNSIDELVIGKGAKKEKYKPDYVVFWNKEPFMLIDAKDPEITIENYLYQVSSYALRINQKYSGEKPLRYCVLTNGIAFNLYKWDRDQVELTLAFADFVNGNLLFDKLFNLISKDALVKQCKTASAGKQFVFTQMPVANLDAIFRVCHDLIWKKEKMKPTSAFYEFSKLFFVKIDHDKRVHNLNRPPENKDFKFTVEWVESRESDTVNPVSSILFTDIVNELDRKVVDKKQKRIFKKDEKINLKPSTIKEIVKILEHIDLYGIDEDLNGRMFEAFLSATIRGKELGQFFTPRTVVEFMVDLADLKANKNYIDTVLDGCCGTGGFLIDAMADMWRNIRNNRSLSSIEKDKLKLKVVTEHLWGLDADKDEHLRISRIARMNMVFHGDGNNRIYWVPDSLDKKLEIEKGIPDELYSEADEFKGFLDDGLTFDVVLTNPPFSMNYETKTPDEKAILENYEIAKKHNTNKFRASLKSNVMFLERYLGLLKPHGKLITIIDESVLNADNETDIRAFIRKYFIIRAVISLPRNTFVNADTQVKTSVLYLVKKEKQNESQPSVFMAISQNVGHTDAGKKSPELNDLPIVLSEFKKFECGDK